MKSAIIPCTLLFNIGLLAQQAVIHIPESKDPVTVSLSQPVKNDGGFSSILVRANGHATTFHPKNPVACAPINAADRKNDLDWSEIKGMALDPSLCLHISTYGSETKHSLLAFMSRGGASDAGPAFMLGFHDDGTPYKILERDQLDLLELISNEDGTASLVGLPSLSQVFLTKLDYNPKHDPYATTYDPRAVYILKPDQPASYSLEQSRSFNLAHYVWAGPKASESYAVLYNIPGHARPFVQPAAAAEKTIEKVQRERPR